MTIRLLYSLLALSLLATGCRLKAMSQEGAIPDYTRTGDHEAWEMKITSFNVWGLPVISKDKSERMPAIGARVREIGPDVAFFQEAWAQKGRDQIFYDAAIFPFQDSFEVPRTAGSGLFIMSKYAFERRAFNEFTFASTLRKVLDGEPIAGKGVSVNTADIRGLQVSLFNVHAMARSGVTGKEYSDVLSPERTMQLFEVFRHIVEQTDSDAFILAGDINTLYDQVEFQFFQKISSLPSNLRQHEDKDFCTSCPDNSYQKEWAHGSQHGQIDYVFLSPRLKFVESELDFDRKFEDSKGRMLDYSDHYGWRARIAVQTKLEGPTPEQVRARTTEAIRDLRKILVDYKNELIFSGSFEFEGSPWTKDKPSDGKVEGIENRLCKSCRIKESLEAVDLYEAALDRSFKAASKKEARIVRRVADRLDSYFALFAEPK